MTSPNKLRAARWRCSMATPDYSSSIRRRKRSITMARSRSDNPEVSERTGGIARAIGTTRDGEHIVLSANIELPDDVTSVSAHGAEGIGLYRTEFLYLDRDSLPGEEEQHQTYRRVAESVRPHPLIIRTFDLGGDKIAGGIDVSD